MTKQSVTKLSVPQFIPRYRVTLVPEGGHTAPYGVLRDSAAAAAALRPYFAGLDREQFLVCCLDVKNASIGVNIVQFITGEREGLFQLVEGDNGYVINFDLGIVIYTEGNSQIPTFYDWANYQTTNLHRLMV